MGNCESICSKSNPIPKRPAIPKNFSFSLIKNLYDHSGKVSCLIELNDKRIATGSDDCFLKIWNIQSFQCEKTYNINNKLLCLLEFEPNMILIGNDKNNIELRNINASLDESKIYTFEGHKQWVNDLAKIDNNLFASASTDTSIKIWNYYSKQCIHTLNCEYSVLCLIKLKNGGLCSGHLDSSIRIWEMQNYTCINTLTGHKNYIKCLCELQNDNIISGSADNTIKVWSNKMPHYDLKGHNKGVRSLCQIDDKHIASASFDHSIKIWDLNQRQCIQTLTGHTDLVTGIIFHSNGYLISCSNDRSIKIWKKQRNSPNSMY